MPSYGPVCPLDHLASGSITTRGPPSKNCPEVKEGVRRPQNFVPWAWDLSTVVAATPVSVSPVVTHLCGLPYVHWARPDSCQECRKALDTSRKTALSPDLGNIQLLSGRRLEEIKGYCSMLSQIREYRHNKDLMKTFSLTHCFFNKHLLGPHCM